MEEGRDLASRSHQYTQESLVILPGAYRHAREPVASCGQGYTVGAWHSCCRDLPHIGTESLLVQEPT